jgi:diacylglycerol kinase (ATP)
MKHIIINPAAAAGATGKRAPEILALLNRYLDGDYTLFMTGGPGEASESARRAAGAGAELIVAVGGDGTLQEVVNGLFSDGRPLSPDCRLGIISSATGGGFAESFGLPRDIETQAALIARGGARRIDVGRAVYANGEAKPRERYFVNEFQAGIGGEVVRKVEAWSKKGKAFGGRLAFGAGTLAAALVCPNQPVSVEVDGRRIGTHRLLGVIAANGSRMAGGMRLTPRARLDDGVLDILLIHGQSVFERLGSFAKIYSGKHLGLAGFSYLQARCIFLSSVYKVDIEADGELWGTLPCRVDILPSALRVICARAEGD